MYILLMGPPGAGKAHRQLDLLKNTVFPKFQQVICSALRLRTKHLLELRLRNISMLVNWYQTCKLLVSYVIAWLKMTANLDLFLMDSQELQRKLYPWMQS